MSPAFLEIITLLVTVLITAITVWGNIQLARINAKVKDVDSNLSTVHTQINSRMDEMLADKQEIGEQIGKDRAEAKQEEKDNIKQ